MDKASVVVGRMIEFTEDERHLMHAEALQLVWALENKGQGVAMCVLGLYKIVGMAIARSHAIEATGHGSDH